jgi:hypothetical protein
MGIAHARTERRQIRPVARAFAVSQAVAASLRLSAEPVGWAGLSVIAGELLCQVCDRQHAVITGFSRAVMPANSRPPCVRGQPPGGLAPSANACRGASGGRRHTL